MAGCHSGALAIKPSTMVAASMPATRMAMASVKSTSTRWKESGLCCAPGCGHTVASRRRSCLTILPCLSSCTTPNAEAKPCSALSWPLSCRPPQNTNRAREKTMQTQSIGRGELAVTRFGFGASGLGNLFEIVPDDRAQATLRTAWDAGIRYYDTSPLYGFGLSELRLGQFLRSVPREDFVVSTKGGALRRAATRRTGGPRPVDRAAPRPQAGA